MPSKLKTSRREVSDIKQSAVVTWHKAGKFSRQITILEDIPRSTVLSILHHAWRNPKDPIRTQKRSGQPPKISQHDAQKLCHAAEENNELCLAALSTPGKSGHTLHINTTRRVLRQRGIFWRKARIKPYLSLAHKVARLKWYQEWEFWSVEQWRSVIWTDKSTFEVGKDLQVLWVSRHVREAYLEKNCKPSFKSGKISIGIWGVISGIEKGPLVVIDEWFNQHRYQEEILEPAGLPFFKKLKEMLSWDRVLSTTGGR